MPKLSEEVRGNRFKKKKIAHRKTWIYRCKGEGITREQKSKIN